MDGWQILIDTISAVFEVELIEGTVERLLKYYIVEKKNGGENVDIVVAIGVLLW